MSTILGPGDSSVDEHWSLLIKETVLQVRGSRLVFCMSSARWALVRKERRSAVFTISGWLGEVLNNDDSRAKGGTHKMCYPWARYLT